MKQQKGVGRMWHLYKMGGITPAIASMMGAQNAQQMAFIRSMNKEQRKASVLDQSLRELEVVVFDLETTGFNPYNGDEIISIGAVALRGAREVTAGEGSASRFYTLVNPGRRIPPHISGLTGITNAMTDTAPELVQALADFMKFVDKRVLIAHGSGHDKQFLNAALWRTSKISLSHRVLDTMMIAKWLEPKLPSYGLDELLELNGIPAGERHHALEDSLMTADLWRNYLARILTRNITSLSDLYAYLSKP